MAIAIAPICTSGSTNSGTTRPSSRMRRQTVLDYLLQVYRGQPPQFVYYKILLNSFAAISTKALRSTKTRAASGFPTPKSGRRSTLSSAMASAPPSTRSNATTGASSPRALAWAKPAPPSPSSNTSSRATKIPSSFSPKNCAATGPSTVRTVASVRSPKIACATRALTDGPSGGLVSHVPLLPQGIAPFRRSSRPISTPSAPPQSALRRSSRVAGRSPPRPRARVCPHRRKSSPADRSRR